MPFVVGERAPNKGTLLVIQSRAFSFPTVCRTRGLHFLFWLLPYLRLISTSRIFFLIFRFPNSEFCFQDLQLSLSSDFQES